MSGGCGTCIHVFVASSGSWQAVGANLASDPIISCPFLAHAADEGTIVVVG